MPREHRRTVVLPVSCKTAFELLVTPGHICGWWSAASAIVIPELGGVWVAAWGEDVDRPDYITAATISIFEPAGVLELSDYRYYAREGKLPFDADFVTRFEVSEHTRGSELGVTQSGFPDSAAADDYYHGCAAGWDQTLAALREYAAHQR